MSYGYAEARQTLQWSISIRVMQRQAEQKQPVPDTSQIKKFNFEIDLLMKTWADLDPQDVAFFAAIQEFHEPEVRQFMAMLEPDTKTVN